MADNRTEWGTEVPSQKGPEIIWMSTEKRPWDLHMFFFQVDTGAEVGYTITSSVLGLVAKVVVVFNETKFGVIFPPSINVKLNRPTIFTAKDCEKALYIARKLLDIG